MSPWRASALPSSALRRATTTVALVALVNLWLAPAASAAASDDIEERSWLGWAVGLSPAILVIGIAYLVARYLRNRRRP